MQTLEKNKQERIVEKARLEELKSKAEQSISKITGNRFLSSASANRKAIQTQIDNYNIDISRLSTEINEIESKIQKSHKLKLQLNQNQ